MLRKGKSLPFQGLSVEDRARFGALGLAVLCLLYVSWSFRYRGIFEYSGIDFRTVYAFSMIWVERGVAAMSDLPIQVLDQRDLVEVTSFGAARMPFLPVPMPSLPVFVMALIRGYVVVLISMLVGAGSGHIVVAMIEFLLIYSCLFTLCASYFA